MFRENVKKPDRYPLECIYYYPTESCNLRCAHCWVAPGYAESCASPEYVAQNANNLSFDELKTVVDDALPLGLRGIKITGGEPFLHPRMIDYLRFFKSKGLSLSLETNGTLLDEERIKELKNLGCATSVSLDGATAEIHDRARGVAGSFDRTVRALEMMSRNGCCGEVIFSLHKDTLPGLTGIMELLDGLRGFSLKINILSVIGRGKQLSAAGGAVDIETILALNQRIEREYAKRYSNVEIYLHIPIAFTPIRKLFGDAACYCRICNIIGLLSDGRVSYCGIGRLENDLILGDVRREKLSEIWTKSPSLAEFRRKMPEELKGICGSCIHRDQCLGGCVAQTYALTKDLCGAHAFCETAHQKGLFPASRIINR